MAKMMEEKKKTHMSVCVASKATRACALLIARAGTQSKWSERERAPEKHVKHLTATNTATIQRGTTNDFSRR